MQLRMPTHCKLGHTQGLTDPKLSQDLEELLDWYQLPMSVCICVIRKILWSSTWLHPSNQ
jgi:hypothetical protein